MLIEGTFGLGVPFGFAITHNLYCKYSYSYPNFKIQNNI